MDLEAYAKLSVALSARDADRAALLAAHGLDEEGWERIEDAWSERLAAAIEDFGDGDGAPPLVIQHAEAFARAQQASVQGVASFETFVEVTRAMLAGHDPAGVLQRLHLTFNDYLASHRHWTQAMVSDPELAARFEAAMR